MWGNTGRIIKVDLSEGATEVPRPFRKNTIATTSGGSGLAARVFLERGDFSPRITLARGYAHIYERSARRLEAFRSQQELRCRQITLDWPLG